MTLVCICVCARAYLEKATGGSEAGGGVWPYVAEGTCFHSSCNLLCVHVIERYE